jgi:hypothetical protein
MRPNSIDEFITLRNGVPHDAETRRIYGLLRRPLRASAEQAKDLTDQLASAHGAQTLWAEQAAALREIKLYGGVICGLGTGEGKTLVSLLAPTLLSHIPRPLLLTPSASISSGKVLRAYEAAKEHWLVRDDIHWLGYGQLSRAAYADYLTTYNPGMLILDEAHRAGRYDSAITKRIERWRALNPRAPIICLSGTLMASRFVEDIARLCEWSLGAKSPVPRTSAKQTLRNYKLATAGKIPFGVLGDLKAVGRRYRETPGVVVSTGKRAVSASLYATPVHVDVGPEIVEAFKHLRAGKLPDGSEVIDPDGHKTWQIATALALGFWRKWEPHPPLEWLHAYRTWAAYCREVIADGSNDLDTELRVRNASIHDPDCWPLHEWLRIKPLYNEPKITVWLTRERLKAAHAWLKAHPTGLLWTAHPAFGNELARRGGWHFYHQNAKDRNGASVLDHKRGTAAVVSVAACSTDLDGMQKIWNTNLYVSPMASGDAHEQSLARTHRHGQEAAEVHTYYWIACRENAEALDGAREKESTVSLIENRSRKLLIAEWTEHENKQRNNVGPQWAGKKRP